MGAIQRKAVLSMNQNYDNRNQNTGNSGYTPNGTRYDYVYTGEGVKRSRGRSAVKTAVTVLAVLLAMVLIVFATANYVSYRYEKMLENAMNGGALGGADTDSSADSTPSQEPAFLPSGEDVQIVVSDSKGTEVKGEIGDGDLTITDVTALVQDSVVEVITSEAYRNGLVYESGAGSGVIINEKGMIITNNHVIESASAINVRLTNGHTYEAKLVATDPQSDLAILKIDPNETLSYAVLGKSANVVTGETVIAIGNPLGLLGGTVTDGIISATSREVTIDGDTMTLLQHNAAVSPGNSGGALFNLRGELIGIVNAKYSSEGAEGLGFAIPSDTVVRIYEDLIRYGYVKGRPDSGITLGTMYYNFFNYAICITESRYTDALLPYDVLVSIDGVQPKSLAEAEAMLKSYEIGDVITVVVSRTEGRTSTKHTVEITVREYEP